LYHGEGRRVVSSRARGADEESSTTRGVVVINGRALFDDPAATLDDLQEAVTTLEDTARTARRVLGGSHPLTNGIEYDLQNARAALCANEEDTQP